MTPPHPALHLGPPTSVRGFLCVRDCGSDARRTTSRSSVVATVRSVQTPHLLRAAACTAPRRLLQRRHCAALTRWEEEDDSRPAYAHGSHTDTACTLPARCCRTTTPSSTATHLHIHPHTRAYVYIKRFRFLQFCLRVFTPRAAGVVYATYSRSSPLSCCVVRLFGLRPRARLKHAAAFQHSNVSPCL